MLAKLLVATVLVLGPFLAAGEASADTAAPAAAPAATPAYDASLRTTREKVDALRALAAKLQKAAEEPAPPKLSAADLAELKKYDAWVRTASERLGKLATSWEQKIDQLRAACGKDRLCNRAATAKALAETNMSFNLQYLQLQSQMQRESRSYTAISNIMKTKHDTVANSISNVR